MSQVPLRGRSIMIDPSFGFNFDSKSQHPDDYREKVLKALSGLLSPTAIQSATRMTSFEAIIENYYENSQSPKDCAQEIYLVFKKAQVVLNRGLVHA